MKIKLLFSVIALLFVVIGCQKDDLVTEKENSNLKSQQVKTVPLHANLYGVITEIQDGVPLTGFLGGTMSHLGQLILENSSWQRTYYEYREGPTLYWEVIGDVAASNGDLLHYTLWGELNLALNQYVSEVTYNGGTGRFENATGFLDVTGYLDETQSLIMEGDGSITTVGSTN